MPIYFGNKSIIPQFGGKIINSAYFGDKLVYVRRNPTPPEPPEPPVPPVPTMTMRFKFTNSAEAPTASKYGTWLQGSTWTKISGDENIWDFKYPYSDWTKAFYDKFTYRNTSGEVYMISANVSGITSINSAFKNCLQLKNIVPFDTSVCKQMACSFNNCGITSAPLLNTSAVETMHMTFNYSPLKEIPFDWDFRSVKSLDGCFEHCFELEYDVAPGESVRYLNTDSLMYMQFIFHNCSKLKRVPAMNTSKVTYMWGELANAGITASPGEDWQYNSVTSIYQTFSGCTELLDGGNMPGLEPIVATEMFSGCKKMVTPPAMSFRKLKGAESMFANCSSMTSFWNTNYPSDPYGTEFGHIRYMYYNCRNIQSGISSYYDWMSQHNKFDEELSAGYDITHLCRGVFYNCGVDGPASAELNAVGDPWYWPR